MARLSLRRNLSSGRGGKIAYHDVDGSYNYGDPRSFQAALAS
jgi:hypothetical protein